MSDTIVLKNKGLLQLLKAFKNLPVTRVGVLGNGKSNRKEGASTNAEVGAAHEFGTSKLPQRSFLRMPITKNLQKYLDVSGAFTPKVLDEVVKTGSVGPWMAKMGVTAEAVVADAFDTGGFGEWKPSDMTHKENWQTLVETQQLRNSITSDVK